VQGAGCWVLGVWCCGRPWSDTKIVGSARFGYYLHTVLAWFAWLGYVVGCEFGGSVSVALLVPAGFGDIEY
jgi:hypothetical protein